MYIHIYRAPFAGPVGTSLLLWVHERDLNHLAEIISSDMPPISPLLRANTRGQDEVTLIIIRSLVAELHDCTLKVVPAASRDGRATVRVRGSCVYAHILTHMLTLMCVYVYTYLHKNS